MVRDRSVTVEQASAHARTCVMADQWSNQGYGGYQQGGYNPQQQQQQPTQVGGRGHAPPHAAGVRVPLEGSTAPGT